MAHTHASAGGRRVRTRAPRRSRERGQRARARADGGRASTLRPFARHAVRTAAVSARRARTRVVLRRRTQPSAPEGGWQLVIPAHGGREAAVRRHACVQAAPRHAGAVIKGGHRHVGAELARRRRAERRQRAVGVLVDCIRRAEDAGDGARHAVAAREEQLRVGQADGRRCVVLCAPRAHAAAFRDGGAGTGRLCRARCDPGCACGNVQQCAAEGHAVWCERRTSIWWKSCTRDARHGLLHLLTLTSRTSLPLETRKCAKPTPGVCAMARARSWRVRP
eukprot:542181-Prymnesium_polylepis.2